MAVKGPLIEEGHEVILFATHDELWRVKIVGGTITQTRAGRFRHDDIINQEYGSRVHDRKEPKKSVVVLPVSPEWRTLSIRHRTQIIYAPDLSLISSLLNCRAGMKILESGTGSGSAAICFARSVGRKGHVFTFEHHEDRYLVAKQVFEEAGYGDVISCCLRDVYQDGFGCVSGHPELGGVEDSSIGGVLLDLPQPWRAIDQADRALECHGRLVIFSPCYEQLQTSAAHLRLLKYFDIEAFEILCKPWGVWTESDVQRKIRRTDAAREANIVAGRSKKEFRQIDPQRACLFETSPSTFYQVQMRGHTGYVLVGTKPPSS